MQKKNKNGKTISKEVHLDNTIIPAALVLAFRIIPRSHYNSSVGLQTQATLEQVSPLLIGRFHVGHSLILAKLLYSSHKPRT